MNERIRQLAEQATSYADTLDVADQRIYQKIRDREFAELIVKECIDKIETHRIPVGNSAAGEMACEWTYAALKEIRDEIKQYFEIR